MFFILCSGLLSVAQASDWNALVMGDWGGSPKSPYTTKDELSTAKVMGEIAAKKDVTLALGLGDNFYNDGVQSVRDKRFQETFEDAFTADSLLHLPFYFLAGNHDHRGNVEAQVQYSNVSERWNFPNYYYSMTYAVPSSRYKLQFVMIDTVVLCGGSEDLEYCQEKGIPEEECQLQPTGPDDQVAADDQWDWIEDQLKRSDADWLLVAGHYPVYSMAEHGPTNCLVSQLKPMLEEYNVTAFMNGHDHTFEHIQEQGKSLAYLTIGGAHVCDSSTAHEKNIPKNSLLFHGCDDGGFARLKVEGDVVQWEFYYGKSSSGVYTTHGFPRRNVN